MTRGRAERTCRSWRPGVRRLLLATAAAPFALTATLEQARALPIGGQVTTGAATLLQSGSSLTVDQSTQDAAIIWRGFSVAANETVRFNQPNAGSITLNRVIGQNPSLILGRLSANGQVFILNPNGVLFGQGAQVNVGGLVASTLEMTDADFMAGRYALSGVAASAVVNQGAITAAPGGYVALVGPRVTNTGAISAPQGGVGLAAGDRVTLTLSDGGLVGLNIDQATLNALVRNRGVVQAPGGQVILTAEAMDQITRSVVNNSGVIEAGQSPTAAASYGWKAGT